MKSLRIAEAAQADLRDIKRYTEQTWGADQARRYLEEFQARFSLLRKRSQLGAPRDELGDGLHSLPCNRHVIFYQDVADRIEIVRVLHASMDSRRHLMAPAEPAGPRSVGTAASPAAREKRRRKQRSPRS